MNKNFRVTGMTCEGCKAAVEKSLRTVKDVSNVSVDLSSSSALIASHTQISLGALQQALPEKYQITEQLSEEKEPVLRSTDRKKTFTGSKLKQLRPLLLIFGYLIVATLLLNKDDFVMHEVMLDFMGLFYFVFSFFKLLDIKGFAQSFSMYDPLAYEFSIYGRLYPFIEVVLGIMLLYRFEVEIALALTIIILGLTTVGVTKTLISNKKIRCACLGTTLNLPMTEATFIENAIMIIMSFLLIFGIV